MGVQGIRPCFGGMAGEACRIAAVNASTAQITTLKQPLDIVMTTELYQTVNSYCQS